MEQDTTTAETSVGSLASIVGADGPLGFSEVLGLGADIADSLAETHSGAAHGAVHPRSVVRGGAGPWMLAAPGLAAGTKAALAPELSEGDEPTHQGDVFALGATLVFALTGQEFVEGALGASEPANAAVPDDIDPASPSTTGPLSLPEVMALFLDTLRGTLANDPALRGTAGRLAGTLRQLRSDAERAMAPIPSVMAGVGAAAAGATVLTVGTSAASAETASPISSSSALVGDPSPPGTIAVEGANPAQDPAKKSFKQRFPALLAAAAIIVAVAVGVMYVRKGDKPASNVTATGVSTTITTLPPTSVAPQTVIVVVTEAPTSSSSTSTTKPPTTTVPAPVVVPVKIPPPPVGTIGMTVDMSQMSLCLGCPASLRATPSKFAQILSPVPDKTVLWAQCFALGDETHDDAGYTTKAWIFVVGPFSQGYIPLTFAGRVQPAELPPCTPVTTTTPTTVPPTTTTTLPPPTTTTTKVGP